MAICWVKPITLLFQSLLWLPPRTAVFAMASLIPGGGLAGGFGQFVPQARFVPVLYCCLFAKAAVFVMSVEETWLANVGWASLFLQVKQISALHGFCTSAKKGQENSHPSSKKTNHIFYVYIGENNYMWCTAVFRIELAAGENPWDCGVTFDCLCDGASADVHSLSPLPFAFPDSPLRVCSCAWIRSYYGRQAPVLITPVINQSCCCQAEDSKLMVPLLLGFTIWKILYCCLVTFPCTFMLIYVTVFFDLWQVFFMCNSAINCAALLSMVMNLRYSVNCGMGGKGGSLLKRLWSQPQTK